MEASAADVADGETEPAKRVGDVDAVGDGDGDGDGDTAADADASGEASAAEGDGDSDPDGDGDGDVDGEADASGEGVPLGDAVAAELAYRLRDGVLVAVAEAVGDADAVPVPVAVPLDDAVGERLALAVAVLVPLGDGDGDGDAVTLGAALGQASTDPAMLAVTARHSGGWLMQTVPPPRDHWLVMRLMSPTHTNRRAGSAVVLAAATILAWSCVYRHVTGAPMAPADASPFTIATFWTFRLSTV